MLFVPKTKIYLSMPISNYDVSERIERSEKIVKALKKKFPSTIIVTPFTACPYDPENSYGKCMTECLKEMLKCQFVCFDIGYEKSNGCKIEKEIADVCEIPSLFIDNVTVNADGDIDLKFKSKN